MISRILGSIQGLGFDAIKREGHRVTAVQSFSVIEINVLPYTIDK